MSADHGSFAFDRETAVEPLGEGRYAASVSAGYNIGPYPNGGYTLAIVTAAMRRELDGLPDPLALSAHYLRPTEGGRPAEVTVERVRVGRGHATLAARLVQDGAERLRVLGTWGDLDSAAGPTVELGAPPDLPPVEACVGARGGEEGVMPNGLVAHIRDRLDSRLDPSTAGWASGRPSGAGEVAGYLRFADGREPDTVALALLCDAMPPAVFNLAPGGWVPTIELTVHVRARPAPGWLRTRFTTRHLRDGYLEEDGELWDSAGTLVCLSRQLARLNPAPAG